MNKNISEIELIYLFDLGVKVPNADWISDERKGLTLCDATSAVFAMDLPWKKLDVVTFRYISNMQFILRGFFLFDT